MRRLIAAIHFVGLGLWLGSLTFSVALAATLFVAIGKPLCPGCQKTWSEAKEVVACTTCGALEHAECAARLRGCALEHAGSHECRTLPSDVASPSSSSGSPTGLSGWSRVRLASADAPAARRLLWRLDATTVGLKDSSGQVPLVGSVFELPRPAVGDALAKSFDLSQAFAIACAILSLGTVLLTPPGGTLRLFRALALALALALAAASIHVASEIATKRLDRESFVGETPEQRADFGRTHGLSSAAGIGELVLVALALALATMRREGESGESGARPHTTP